MLYGLGSHFFETSNKTGKMYVCFFLFYLFILSFKVIITSISDGTLSGCKHSEFAWKGQSTVIFSKRRKISSI